METSGDSFYQDLQLRPTRIVVVLRSRSVLTFYVTLSEYLSMVRHLSGTTVNEGFKTYATTDGKVFALNLNDVSCVMEEEK